MSSTRLTSMAHYRLILEVDDQPIPRREDGGIDTGSVESLVVLEIADTH